MSQSRQLAAIMFADIVGYTAIMGEHEEKALTLLDLNRSIHISFIEKYQGTLLKELGNGYLASFKSAHDAVNCAAEIQNEMSSSI